MKKIIFLFLFFFITNCSDGKKVYWCGDHPCINKKEKEAYFKKTMIVEVKSIDKNKIKKNSQMEKILEQASINEKKRLLTERQIAKKEILENKSKIKLEKEQIKKARLEEKERIKQEKLLAKQIKLEEKERIKQQKLLAKEKLKDKKKKGKVKKKINIMDIDKNNKLTFKNNEFDDLVKKIKEVNMLKSYPDINNIPN